MRIDPNIINIDKFSELTNKKWDNQSLEFFKCLQCDCVVVGIPDCHIALIDPSNLKKKMSYNLPRTIKCPNCKVVWYHFYKDKEYKVEDISLDELLSSNWGNIFSKK